MGRAIRHFVTDSIQEKQFPIGRLFGMPLVNFLNDTSQPYEDIFSKDYEQLIKMWSHLDKTFSLKVIRSIVSKTNARYNSKCTYKCLGMILHNHVVSSCIIILYIFTLPITFNITD